MNRLVHVHCPGCGSPDCLPELAGKDPYSSHPFALVRCKKCGLVYVNPRPDGEDLAFYYPTDYYGARHPAFKNLFIRLRVRKLGPAANAARLLDIGCGRADFILACKTGGWDVVGVEQANSPVMRMRDSLGVQIVTPEALQKLPNASFDVVTLWHVLEHLPQPREQLREVYRLLRPGGRLFVEAPNFGSWHARIGRSSWYHLDLPRHLLHFERPSLSRLLSACGFVAERWQTFSLEYDAFGLAQSFLNRICSSPNHLFQLLIGQPTPGGRLDTLLSFLLFPALGALSAIISLLAPLVGQGGVLRVVARKRLPQ